MIKDNRWNQIGLDLKKQLVATLEKDRKSEVAHAHNDTSRPSSSSPQGKLFGDIGVSKQIGGGRSYLRGEGLPKGFKVAKYAAAERLLAQKSIYYENA